MDFQGDKKLTEQTLSQVALNSNLVRYPNRNNMQESLVSDDFSFAAGRESSNDPRKSSVEDSINRRRLATLSSHNLKDESQRSTCHHPLVSYSKR